MTTQLPFEIGQRVIAPNSPTNYGTVRGITPFENNDGVDDLYWIYIAFDNRNGFGLRICDDDLSLYYDQPQPATDQPAADGAHDAGLTPTAEERHRYAVAWGESQLVHLTDWRYWEKLYDDALEVIRLQAIEIERLQSVVMTKFAAGDKVQRIDGTVGTVKVVTDDKLYVKWADNSEVWNEAVDRHNATLTPAPKPAFDNCPSCHSRNISVDRAAFGNVIWICRDCDAEWKQPIALPQPPSPEPATSVAAVAFAVGDRVRHYDGTIGTVAAVKGDLIGIQRDGWGNEVPLWYSTAAMSHYDAPAPAVSAATATKAVRNANIGSSSSNDKESTVAIRLSPAQKEVLEFLYWIDTNDHSAKRENGFVLSNICRTKSGKEIQRATLEKLYGFKLIDRLQPNMTWDVKINDAGRAEYERLRR